MSTRGWTRQVSKWLATLTLDPTGRPPGALNATSGKLSPIPWLSSSLASLWLYVPSFTNWSLRARLIAIVLALALPLNLVIAAVVWSLAGAAQEAQRASLLYSARSVSAALDAELGKYLALAKALSRSPAFLAGDLTAFEHEARRTFEGVPDAWVLVADLDGQQLMNTASPTQ